MNQFGIDHVWEQGDIVTRTVAVILLFMSILSWSVIFYKVILNSSLLKISRRLHNKFWNQPNISDAISSLGNEKNNPFRDLALSGQAAICHKINSMGSISNNLDVSDWLSRSLKDKLDDANSSLQSGLGILASIGSTAPFVGLLGTVWGIYHALQAISMTEQPDLSHISGSVGEALIMTACGLFVAIPAVLGFNAINRKNKNIQHIIIRFSSDLYAYYLTGDRIKLENISKHK